MRNKLQKFAIILAVITVSAFSYGKTPPTSVRNIPNYFANAAPKAIDSTTTSLRNAKAQKVKPKVKLINGSFSANVVKEQLTKEDAVSQFANWFNLNENHQFSSQNKQTNGLRNSKAIVPVAEKTDELGIKHSNFQQTYKGIPIEGQMIMLHSKDGVLKSLNGQIAEFEDIDLTVNVTDSQAVNIAKEYLRISILANEYPVETIIAKIPNENGAFFRLTKKVRIDSYSPLLSYNVYIDAKTGEVLNKISLIANADVSGTAATLYSGTQNIICDSYEGSYRLKDNARNISTYDATNWNPQQGEEPPFFTSTSTTWSGVPHLSSFRISAVATSWWYSAFSDEMPDLYIKVKDKFGNVVYGGSANRYSDVNPPLTFSNINVYLNNPPYTVEVWDYDAIGSDDFGGSYTISASVGTQSWSGGGNSGTYTIATSGHPACDVHWGMEKTYDFYKNVFDRDSYDGNGSEIVNLVNPVFMNGQSDFPNNASAFNQGSNFVMYYGMGNGIDMYPVVGLDVEGHEFTHLVVDNNGNGGLTYQGESGALNESFADIFGTCIEFYSGVDADWTIGENLRVQSPYYMRNMANPNITGDPDTYNGTYWKNTNDLSEEGDYGGVHHNSGVQNYWFYLLCQGGSDTNNLGNTYTVTGIGMSKAQQIAYRNLMHYLTPNATYADAYNGSLQAAEDLYGNPSAEYTAVRRAWYAVGIGNDPDNYCSGTTTLTEPSGTITDGSGSADYGNNANCVWVIKPVGATQITLDFTSFNVESDYDFVKIYAGVSENENLLLASYSGTSVPTSVTTPAGCGAMYIKFESDTYITAAGWSANYTSTVTATGCDLITTLTKSSGTITDGSGNYGNNQGCIWQIAPPCATSVTLSFSQFDTEEGYDGVVVFDNLDMSGTPIGIYSGTTIPASITSYTGEMAVAFVSDYATVKSGFTANYTSTGTVQCSGVTVLNSSDAGTFSDGSDANTYCRNLDCRWLIQPPQASTVTLNFTDFDLEESSSDGTVFDVVEVYDGSTTSAPLLGRFNGSNIPPFVTSTGGSMLVRFVTDMYVNKQGWTANYTSTMIISGINEITINNTVKVFPNPAKDELFIKSDLSIQKFEIYTLAGVLLISESNFNEKISVSTLPQGIYLLKVYTEKGLVISKVVKE